MKREYLFRGKDAENSEWVEGYLVKWKTWDDLTQQWTPRFGIISTSWCNMKPNDCTVIIPETVGQFTGFHASKYKRKLNTKIFEGDIFRGHDADENEVYLVVMWIEQRGAFYMVPIEHYEIIKDNNVSDAEGFEWLFEEALLYDFSVDVGLTKVGNVHDNPELLNK